ncbi:hypothetical protein WT27_13675 [Burkholderia territorii]|uniref:Uncharacterized protein n=1 Tax=Burkholderia territorii TaxID=1503055 RepID=A0A105V4B9_9BURK|nr:hypothetical protein [Burkholderia territorii]KVV40965.1 hypothetical protein WT27_13675 [Burkholderia territorii]KVX33914.1 hypothetical protein WT31_09585 [Burkholderia territorii]
MVLIFWGIALVFIATLSILFALRRFRGDRTYAIAFLSFVGAIYIGRDWIVAVLLAIWKKVDGCADRLPPTCMPLSEHDARVIHNGNLTVLLILVSVIAIALIAWGVRGLIDARRRSTSGYPARTESPRRSV